ncbi:uncharacterized protein BP5553_01315 [Venustampulla echinocandica]|uniref:Uncharacterized protein n=1 Tax=Venustampulla echinocandica TaxID=2656787 RepID=A0A370U0N5_9HELO|nr:uncharacterized protein BP5553_01315 [Venustampulla echinocandica]RDL41336.1 hypothetical protein BP5553_01315 [Venustampulla echinocandica]
MTATSAKGEFGLNAKTMRTLPTLLSPPGQYAESERTYRRRISLVRMLSASAAGSMPHDDPNASSLQQFDSQGQNPYRFMAMVRFPALDRRTGNLDLGVSCQACRLGPRDEGRGYHNWNALYCAAGYLEHFQKCQRRWSSGDRMISAKGPRHFAGCPVLDDGLVIVALAFCNNMFGQASAPIYYRARYQLLVEEAESNLVIEQHLYCTPEVSGPPKP